MFHFTIRDVLWMTVVVAVALTLWLGWSRDSAKLRDESAAREAKLQNDVAAERVKGKERMRGLAAEYRKAMMKLKVQEAALGHFGVTVNMDDGRARIVPK